MKVEVIVKNINKLATTSNSIKANVNPGETAFDVQDRIGSVTNMLCFPDQKLMFNGKVVPEKQTMSACGVKDGDVLELLVNTCEETFNKQLAELLGQKAVTPEELSLLFSYRHFVSVSDALTAMGHAKVDFKTFLNDQKCFSFDGELVKTAKAQKTPLLQKPAASVSNLSPIQEDKVHGPIAVKVTVQIHVPGRAPVSPSYNDDDENMDFVRLEPAETVARAKEVIRASEQIPFPECDLVLGEKKLDDKQSLREAGVTNGAFLVLCVHASVASLVLQLEKVLLERVGLSANDLSLLYCQRFGTPVCQALRSLGLPGNFKRFLEGQPQFSINGGCVTLTNGPKLVTPPPQVDQEYAVYA